MKDPRPTIDRDMGQSSRRPERSPRAESKRLQAEESLRRTEQKFRTIFDNTSDGIFLHDVESWNLVMGNKSCLHMLGYTEEEFLRLSVADLHPEADLPFIHAQIEQVLARGKPLRNDIRFKRKDGSVFFADVSPDLVLLDGNQYVVVVMRDIGERKQAEEALRFTQFAVDHAADAAFWITQDARFFYVNEAACRALGYSREELLSMTVFDIDPAFTESMWVESWRELETGESTVFETVHRARDGRVYPVEIHANCLRFGGREYHCAFARDITERKQAEETLRRINERLELLVAERTEDLTRMVSRLQQLTWELSQAEDRERKRIADLLHDDVQQTLAAARFHLNLLSMETRSAADSREIICQVRQMLKDAIEKARNLSHELSPALYQVDLTEILNWLSGHMQRRHGLTVRVEVQGTVEPSAEPLKALLYKVARELLFNVIKHAGIREATVRVRHIRRFICLSVIDRGRGFDPRDVERATGFGLLSIRERVRLLGGRMKIKSAPGAGSQFRIVVPDHGPLPIANAEREKVREKV